MTQLPHHWMQGPADVRPIVPAEIPGTDRVALWLFTYYIENQLAIAGVTPRQLAERVDWVLNRAPLAWSRAGVMFNRVYHLDDADIVLRFTAESPWGCGPGWYYHDDELGKNVAQVTDDPILFKDDFELARILNMELGGHGTFRMWDMYLPRFGPYNEGVMGDYAAERVYEGYPSPTEIEAACAWLREEAVNVHAT